MAKIAVLIDRLFEDKEYSQPAEQFRKAGHELTLLGPEAGIEIVGKRNQDSAGLDRKVDDADPKEFDALFIPGGYAPDRLRVLDSAVSFVKEFVQADKPVFMICHGPQLLITADVLRDRTVTGWKSIRKDLENAGAEYRDEPVVRDGNLISSRMPDDIPAFVDACLRVLR